MSVAAMEFLVIVLSAVLIVGVVYEIGSAYLKKVEDKREQERIDHWNNRHRR